MRAAVILLCAERRRRRRLRFRFKHIADAGGIVYIQVGNGGLASSPDGGSDTVFNSLEPFLRQVSSPALCAQGGGVGIGDSGGGAGGSASASVGTTKYSREGGRK